MSDPMTMRLKVLDTEPLTWEEARRLAHARVAWRMCQRRTSQDEQAEDAARRHDRRVLLGQVVAVSLFAWICTFLTTFNLYVVAEVLVAILGGWAIYLSYGAMKPAIARLIPGHRRTAAGR